MMTKPHYRVIISQVFQDEYFWKDEFDADNLMNISYYFVWFDKVNYVAVNFIELHKYASLRDCKIERIDKEIPNFWNNYEAFSQKIRTRKAAFPIQFYQHRAEFKGIIPAGFLQYRDKD